MAVTRRSILIFLSLQLLHLFCFLSPSNALPTRNGDGYMINGRVKIPVVLGVVQYESTNTKPQSKLTSPSSLLQRSPAASSKVRRPATVLQVETPEPKKAKKKRDDAEDGADIAKKMNGVDFKERWFRRLWSEEDDVVIPKGTSQSDYTPKKEADPSVDMNVFHDFI